MAELRAKVQEESKVNIQHRHYLVEMNFDPSASVTARTEEFVKIFFLMFWLSYS